MGIGWRYLRKANLSCFQRSDMEWAYDVPVDGWAVSAAVKLQTLAGERLPTQQPASLVVGLMSTEGVSDEACDQKVTGRPSLTGPPRCRGARGLGWGLGWG
jgi:hypothetical protein